ncbi:MAG: hypothetical protein JNL72_14505 [Flavipsychrobacter sp.]|nr:hypothetical protein [Flavipsychrobacter sp.]
MKKLLSLALAAIPTIAYCGDKDKLIGNWKEVSRVPPGSGAIAFKDTIKIEFTRGNEYVWQKSGGFIYRGTYKIKGDNLDMGARQFTLLESTAGRIKIKDETATYELVSYVPGAGQTAAEPEKPAGTVTSIEQMQGHWSKFKGTNDQTVKQIDYTRAVKVIDIPGGATTDGKLGTLFGARDGDDSPSWYIESYNPQTQILTCGGKDKRELKVLKCEDNELVVLENGTTYFLRRFR